MKEESDLTKMWICVTWNEKIKSEYKRKLKYTIETD